MAQAPLTTAADRHPFANPNLPLEARVDDLFGRMTLEENVSLMAGSAAFTLAGIELLGVPPVRVTDGATGVRSDEGAVATVFPVGVAQASTWNPGLIREGAAAIARPAEEAVVLVRNDDGLLPLDPATRHRLAVVGPNAAIRRVQGGESSEVGAGREISLLQAIGDLLGEDSEVVHADGGDNEPVPRRPAPRSSAPTPRGASLACCAITSPKSAWTASPIVRKSNGGSANWWPPPPSAHWVSAAGRWAGAAGSGRTRPAVTSFPCGRPGA